ncbi:MAG: hypothetical protein II938_00820 [Alphaproteobacteria bacterium]|nr:hypothetical protein [Alphaproteobacteria bacterium]
MRKLLIFLFCFLVLPVFAQNATPFCTRMSTRIQVKTRPGNPKYVTQYSKEQFLKMTQANFSPYTLGLTVAKPDVTIEVKPKLTQQLEQICVTLSDVTIEMNYPTLLVYIDKKYVPSSCEYQTIKEHEDYHVAVASQALAFFKKDVEKVVTDTVMNLSPKIVYNRGEIKPAVSKYTATIASALQPVLDHIKAKLDEKNAAIDTPEMYQATTAVCNNW